MAFSLSNRFAFWLSIFRNSRSFCLIWFELPSLSLSFSLSLTPAASFTNRHIKRGRLPRSSLLSSLRLNAFQIDSINSFVVFAYLFFCFSFLSFLNLSLRPFRPCRAHHHHHRHSRHILLLLLHLPQPLLVRLNLFSHNSFRCRTFFYGPSI